MIRVVAMVGMILMLGSCGKDNSEVSIDDALLPYFGSFEQEATARGVDFSIYDANISGSIINISGDNVIAQCTHSENAPSRVTVDIDYWNIASEEEKEFYIFHELGHCFLKRVHDDRKDSAGNCKSIMHSSADACKFVYNGNTRTEYLDELFDK